MPEQTNAILFYSTLFAALITGEFWPERGSPSGPNPASFLIVGSLGFSKRFRMAAIICSFSHLTATKERKEEKRKSRGAAQERKMISIATSSPALSARDQAHSRVSSRRKWAGGQVHVAAGQRETDRKGKTCTHRFEPDDIQRIEHQASDRKVNVLEARKGRVYRFLVEPCGGEKIVGL